MRRTLIAVFESRSDAEAARAALLAQGVHDTQVGIEGGSAAGADAQGLAGVIARMFGGAMSDHDPRAGSYADAVKRGATLLAVHGLDDDGIARASPTLLRHGASRVDPHPDGRTGTTRAADGGAQAKGWDEIAAVSSVGGPQVYALPNAPTGWLRGATTAEMRGKSEDPTRPEGELEDAVGLDPEADREALNRIVKRRR
jgi:hypothetical protein